MAQKASEDAAASNVSAATVNQFVRELDAADDKKETAISAIRNIRKRARTEGVNLRVLDQMRALKRRDEDEVRQDELDRIKYAAYLAVDLGTQFEMDVDVPEDVAAQRADYDAKRDGYRFGKDGLPESDNPFEAGTVAHAAWKNGWIDGEKEHFEGAAPAKAKRKPKKGAGPEMGDAAGSAE